MIDVAANFGGFVQAYFFRFDDALDRAADNDFLLCDLDELVEPSLENFYDEMHYNEQGARNVASHLSDCLADMVQAN